MFDEKIFQFLQIDFYEMGGDQVIPVVQIHYPALCTTHTADYNNVWQIILVAGYYSYYCVQYDKLSVYAGNNHDISQYGHADHLSVDMYYCIYHIGT